MPSNIISLSAELASRQDEPALTPKQEITVELRNHYSQQTRLRRACRSHQVAYKLRVREYIEITECIEHQEEKLLRA